MPKLVKVPFKAESWLNKKNNFVLLASYCEPRNEVGCTEKTPCPLCLSMCNVFDEDGNYVRELGSVQRKAKRRLSRAA